MTVVEAWTIDSYLAAVQAGRIDPKRTTLLHGQVGTRLVTGIRHTRAVRRLYSAINGHLVLTGRAGVFEAQAEGAVRPSADDHLPQPDIAVAPWADDGYFRLADCLAIIEVADSSLQHDERVKHTEMYEGFGPYWVIGLENRTLRRYDSENPDGVDAFLFDIPGIEFSIAIDELFALFD